MNNDIPLTEDPGMNEIIPADPKSPLDMQKVIDRLMDPGHLV